MLPAPEPIRVNPQPEQLPPNDVEMSLVDHLEELRQRVFRSLIAIVLGALACLLAVKPLVRLLEEPAGSIRFLQLAPGEFLFVSFKVAGYAGLTLAIPYVLYQGLAFVLPGLTQNERRLIAPAVAGSAVLFFAGIAFSWWALIPAALGFLVSYGADVVEPIWSIERYDPQRKGAPGTAFQCFGQIIQPVKAHKRGLYAFIKFLSFCRWSDATPQFDKKGKAYLSFEIFDQTAYRRLRKIQ